MAKPRHLRSAPILEALLDIRVVPRPNASFDDIRRLEALYSPKYRRIGEKRATGFQIAISAGPAQDQAAAATTRSAPVGIILGDDGSRRLQLALDEFTQNAVGKYPDYETVIAEAKPNWELYRDAYKPLAISRIALRYLNELRLKPGGSFEDYLAVMPSLPIHLPQVLSDFVFRMTIDNESLGAKAIVNQIFQGNVDDDGAQVILDIDAIIERQIDLDDSGLWDLFQELRKFKNDIFFAFVTDRLLERYE